jgi:hypothetical protein
MIPLFAFAILFALIVASAADNSARAASRREDEGTPKDKKAAAPIDPAHVAAAVKRAVASEQDPAKVDAIAKKLEDAGHPAAAAAARERSAELRQGKSGSKSTEKIFPSPFTGVAARAWDRYVQAMASADPETVSATNQLGMFQIGFPRLSDLGYVEKLRRAQKGGRTVWTADFKAPYSLSGFLKDPTVQYGAFVKIAKADRSAILKRHADFIGKTIAGAKVTLSGLLAVSYFAGLAGLGRWLSSEDERTRSPRTTAAYQRGDGLF